VELVSLPSNTFDLFQNISQFYFREVSFDFHNDFNCEQVIFENNRLCLVFVNDLKIMAQTNHILLT